MTDRLRSTLVIFIMSQIVLLSGCDPWTFSKNEASLVPEGTISCEELAEFLCLRIVSRSKSSAQMSDKGNSVMIFSGPLGRVFVNGEAVGAQGRIIEKNSTLYIPSGMKNDIRSRLNYHRPADNRVVIRNPSPSPAPTPSVFYLGPVVLDPGHGGKDDGATGCNGLKEKHVNLAVARKTAEILRSRGVDVRMTRDSDIFIELNDRAKLADECGAELFVSIHADWASNKSARGYTVYIPRTRVEQARPLAWKIANNMEAAGIESRGVRPAGYRVLLNTSCSAVLVELGFLSNWTDAQLLLSDHYQSLCAAAIADGVYDALK